MNDTIAFLLGIFVAYFIFDILDKINNYLNHKQYVKEKQITLELMQGFEDLDERMNTPETKEEKRERYSDMWPEKGSNEAYNLG